MPTLQQSFRRQVEPKSPFANPFRCEEISMQKLFQNFFQNVPTAQARGVWLLRSTRTLGSQHMSARWRISQDLTCLIQGSFTQPGDNPKVLYLCLPKNQTKAIFTMDLTFRTVNGTFQHWSKSPLSFRFMWLLRKMPTEIKIKFLPKPFQPDSIFFHSALIILQNLRCLFFGHNCFILSLFCYDNEHS